MVLHDLPLVEGMLAFMVSTSSFNVTPGPTIQTEKTELKKHGPFEKNPFEPRFEKAIVNPTVVSQTSGIPLSNFPVPTQPYQSNSQPAEKTAGQPETRQTEQRHKPRSETRFPHKLVFLRRPHGFNTRENENRNRRRPRDALARG